ncbi:MAG: hypothetical protein Phog2KO_50850 [Phototrophicaceae bacterium]
MGQLVSFSKIMFCLAYIFLHYKEDHLRQNQHYNEKDLIERGKGPEN